MIYVSTFIDTIFILHLFLFPHPFLAFIPHIFFFLSNSVVMRVSCDSPSLILIYAHWANRDLIIGAETENNTECYLRLFSQMLFFFPLVDSLPRCGMLLIPNLPFRSNNEETFVWKRARFAWKYFSEELNIFPDTQIYANINNSKRTKHN